MDLTFSGAGFMGCYYFGVVDCWNKYVPRERVNRVAGSSAGSLTAAYYIMDLPMVPCLTAIIELSDNIRKRPLGVFDRKHQIVDILPQVLDRLFPPDAHKIVSGRLFVCMTRLKDMKKVVVSEFESRQDLIDALNCSCFIPVWSGNHVSTYKGVKHIDGGFSDNLPIFDEHTIRICCFAGQTDISPYDSKSSEKMSTTLSNMPLYFTLKNMKRARRALFPPAANVIMELLERGFHDTKQFILNNDVIQCDHCYSSLRPEEHFFANLRNPLITPSGSPTLVRDEDEPLQLVKSADGLLSVRMAPESALVCGERAASSSCSSSASSEWSSRATPPAEARQAGGRETGRSPSGQLRAQVHAQHIQTSLDANNNLNGAAISPIPIVIEEPIEENERTFRGLELQLGVPADWDVMSAEEAEEARVRAQRNRRPTLPANVPSQKFLERRLSAQLQKPTPPRAEKFKPIGVPLPSCPPSPNLDRHCNECLRLRQAARCDQLEQRMREAAARFLPAPKEAPEDEQDAENNGDAGFLEDCRKKAPNSKRKLTRSFTSPLRWIKQTMAGSSHFSYTLEDVPRDATCEPNSQLFPKEHLKCA